LDYVERGLGSGENNHNLLDKLQDAIERGQNPISILPSSLVEPEIITISDPDVGLSGTSCHFFVEIASCMHQAFYEENDISNWR